MANMKVKPWQWKKIPVGREAKSKDERSRIGQFEVLESRQLLSAFHPLETKFQWAGRGRSGTTEVRFDETGNFLGATGPEAGLHQNGQLGGGTRDPNKILVSFSGAINSRTVSPSDITITGDFDAADPFRITSVRAKKSTLTIFTSGKFSTADGADLTFQINDIQGARSTAVLMDPWSITVGITTTQCTSNCGPNTPPRVLEITPAANAILGQGPTSVVARFSEDLQSASVNTVSFRVVSSGGDNLFGTNDDTTLAPSSVTYDAATDRAQLSFTNPLVNGNYQVRLSGSGASPIRDLQGAALDGDGNSIGGDDFSSTFRVNVSQNAPPTVIAINPEPNATVGQSPAFIEATFSEDILALTVTNSANFQLIRSGDGVFGNGNDPFLSPSRIDYFSNPARARFVVNGSLSNDLYMVRLSGSIQDFSGNGLDGDGNGVGGDPFTSTFRVVIDPTPPTVLAVNPSANAVLSQSSPSFVDVQFSEAVRAATVTNPNNFTLIGSGGDGGFNNGNEIGITASSITYDPASNRAFFWVNGALANDVYQVRLVGTGGVQDLAGNFLDGDGNGQAGGTFTSSFVVAIPNSNDQTPPTVTSITPAPGATKTVPVSSIEVVFSEEMDRTTVTDPANFRLISSGGDQQFTDGNELAISPSRIDYVSGSRAARFVLSNALPNNWYQVRLLGSGSMRDLAGNRLDGNGDGFGGDDFVAGFLVAVAAGPDPTPGPQVDFVLGGDPPDCEPVPTCTPTVDTFGSATPKLDISYISAFADPTNAKFQNLYVNVRFNTTPPGGRTIEPPSANEPNSVFGFIDIDTDPPPPSDPNSLTGLLFDRTPTSGMSLLGVDFFVDVGSEARHPGSVDVLYTGLKVPLTGDTDFDSDDDLVVYRPLTGEFLIGTNSAGQLFSTVSGPFAFGAAGEVPFLGDWDPDPNGSTGPLRADGDKDFGTFNPATGIFKLDLNGDRRLGEDRNGNGMLDTNEDRNGNGVLDFGEDCNNNGQLDRIEDIDNDGKLDPGEDVNNNGFLDPDEDLNGNCFLDRETFFFSFLTASGNPDPDINDQVVIGDWDGDGDDDIGVYRASTGRFLLDLNGNYSTGRSEDLNRNGILNDGRDNRPLLNEAQDNRDYNNDGDRLDMVSEDGSGADPNKNGVLDTGGETEDLNGDGFFNDGITGHPKLNEAADGRDYNDDGDTNDIVSEDLDANGRFDAPFRFGPAGFPASDVIVVTGDWNRSGESKVGLFVRGERDANGNGLLDASEDFNSNDLTDALAGIWFLDVDGDLKQDPNEDRNGNSKIDCGIDNTCGTGDLGDEDLDSDTVLDNDGPFVFGSAMDAPLVGSWITPGRDDIGVRRVNTNQFFLDLNTEDANGNGRLDCGVDNLCGTGDPGDEDGNANGILDSGDRAIGAGDGPFFFGAVGDIPIVGSFGFDAKTDIGVFRPTVVTGNQVTGDFFLIDSNANRVFGGLEGPYTVEPPAPIEFLTESFTVKLPLRLLGGDEGVVDFMATVGPFAGFTDETPNPGRPPATSAYITPLHVADVNFITATGEDVRFSPPVIPNSLRSTISIPSGGIVPGTAGIQATLAGGHPSLMTTSLLDPRSVNAATVLLEGSGGDEVFGNGNEVQITANQIVVGSGNFPNDTIFFDLTGVTLKADLYRFTIVGDDPVRDVHGIPLDGEIFDHDFDGRITPPDLPSGNGISQGDFVATFRLDSQPAIISFRLTRPEDQNVDLGNAPPGDSGVLGDGTTNQVRPSFVGVVTDDRLPIIGDDPGDTFGLDPTAPDLDLFGASAEFNLGEDVNGNGLLDCGVDLVCGTGDPGDEDVNSNGFIDGKLLHLGLRFTTDVNLASSGDPSSVSGFIDIDADQDPTSGATGWIRDLNASRTQDFTDGLITLGRAGDLPVTGRWLAGGGTRLGVYRPSTGEFFLDVNGDGSFNLLTPKFGTFTANASTDTITANAHGLLNGDSVTFTSNGTLPGGLSPATEYFVINSQTDTFQVSARFGESAVNITSAGSGTHSFTFGEGPFASNVLDGIPRVGDFNGDGGDEVGVFAGGLWTIDLNGDRLFDPSFTYGTAVDLPVVGNWVNNLGLRFDRVGVFTSATATLAPNWRLDVNGNRSAADDFPFRFGRAGLADQLPVVGDWNGDGFDKVGTYNSILSEWRIDINGNNNLEGTEGPFVFGDPRSTPVIADWDGDGDDDIATFNTGSPTNLGFGQWLIDSDGSRTFTTGDGPFRFGLGREDSNLNGVLDQGEDTNGNGIADPPDLPVAGKWEVAGVPAIEATFGVFRVKDAGHVTAFGIQGRMDLGVEYFVDLGSEANGRVDLVDARTNGVLMQVEVRRFPDTRTIVVDVPLALVTEAPGGMVTFGGIVGAATEFSDQVPEVPRSAVSAPSLQLELSTGQIACRNDGNFDDGTTFTRGFGTYTFPVAGTTPDALLESTDTCLNKVLVRATDSFDAAHGVLSRVVLERNVSVDLTPPRIYHIVPPDNTAGRDAPRTIRLHFSEDINRNGTLDGGEDLNGDGILNADDLDPATAERASSYRLLAANGQDQTDKIRLIEYNDVEDTVLITLGSGLPSGFYTFEVRGDVDGLTDVAGNLVDGEPNPGARPLQVGQFPTGDDVAGGDFSTTLLLNLGPPRVLSIDAGAPGTVMRTIYDLRNEDINGNGTLDLHEDFNEDGRFNDGIANPLLNEIADGIDYNDDGFLANDLINEDMNGDGRFNNGSSPQQPLLDEVSTGIDYNRNGVFESSVSEDLNGDGFFNNGILHPLLDETRGTVDPSDDVDYNGDGLLPPEVRNFLINEDFNRNGQFDREEDLNQDSIFNDGSDAAHPPLNEVADGIDYNHNGVLESSVSEDLNGEDLDGDGVPDGNGQFDRAEVDFNRNRRLDVGDGPAAPRVIVVTIDSPIDPASVPRDLNRNGRLDCGPDLACGTGDSQDTTGDGVFGPGDDLDEDTRTVFLTRTRTSDQVSGLISSFGDGEFDPFADRLFGYVDLSPDARVLTFVPNPEFLRQDDNGSPLGLAPDHYRFTLIGGGELSAQPTGTQENIIVSCDDFRDELGNPVVELLPGMTAIPCRQENRDDDPTTPGFQSDDRPGYQGTTSIDLFVNLSDPTGRTNVLVMAAEDRGQLFNPLDDEIAVYVSQDSGVTWTKQPFFAGPESRTVTRPGGDVTFDIAIKPSVTFDSYGQSARDEDLNNNNVFNDGSSAAQPLLDEAADGVDYNGDGDTADMVSEDRNANGAFDRSRSTAYVSYLLLDTFNVPDFDVTDPQFGTSWRPDALDAAGQLCDLNRIATDPLCASIVDINDVVGTFDPANYFFEIGFSEVVTPPSANLRRPLFGRIEIDARKDGFRPFGPDDFFIDLDQERLDTTVQSRFVALCRSGSTCDPDATGLFDRPVSRQIPIEYLGNRVRLRVTESLIDTDQDQFANMRAVVTIGVNGPDSDSAPDAVLGAAPVFDRAFRSSAVVVSRATNVANPLDPQPWTASSTDTVVVSIHYHEDQNANGVLDPSEDTNGDGTLDPGEDLNANGRLDPSEDINGNGQLNTSNLVDDAPWITADKVTNLPDGTANSNLGFVYVAFVEVGVEPSNGMLADRAVFVVRSSDVFQPDEDLNNNNVLDLAIGEDTNNNGVLDRGYDPTDKTPLPPVPNSSYSFNPRIRVDDPGVDARRTNPRLATGPFGELFVLWDDFGTAGTSTIRFDRSFDTFHANIVSGHCNSSTIVDSPLNPPIQTAQQLCLPTVITGPGGGPPPASAPMSPIAFRGSDWAGADISIAVTPVNGFQDPDSTDLVSDIDRRTLNPSPAAAVAQLSLCNGRAFPDLVLAEPALESCYSIAAQPNHGITASPSIAVDNSVDPVTNKPGAFNGRIYVAYVGRGNPNDPAGHDDTDIFVTFSDDSGLNWSTYQVAFCTPSAVPIFQICPFGSGTPSLVQPGTKVNDDLDRASQFNPSISVDPFTGNVYLSWYDTRHDEPDFVRASPGNQEAELFFAVGRPEIAGIAFLQNQVVSTRPSDQSLRNAARSPLGFGDYTGIVGSHGIAYPAWTDTRSLLAEVNVSPQLEQPIAEVATARIDVRPAFERPRQTRAITDVFTEDVNGNGVLDGNEDVNCNRILDLSEDANGNGSLDPGEDRNANGVLDLGEDSDGDGRLDFGEDVNQNCLLDQGNPLDGEAINVTDTMVGLPSGDGRAGGNFVAGFVIADRFIFADSSYEEDPLQPSDGSATRPFATLRGAIGLANSIQVTVAFREPVALPSDGLSSHPKVQGYIDLDVDRDASTPVVDFNGDGISDSNFFLSRVNALGLGPSGLGVEFYIDLASESRHPGVADLIAAATRRVVGFVPVAVKGTDLSVPDTLVVTIPRTSIQVGDLVPDLINVAVVVGDDVNGNRNRMIEAGEVRDLAPNQFTDSTVDHFATRDEVGVAGQLDIRTVLIDAVPADPVVVRVRDGRTPGGQSIPYVVQPVPGGQNGSITVGQFTDVDFEPGVVVKLRASNLDIAGKGSNVFVRGVRQNPIIFTSLFNDDLTVGGDTNGDGNNTLPRAGNWGGLVFRTGTDDALSLVNFARLEFGGGVVPRAGVGGLDTDIRPEAITMKAARPAVVNSAIAQSGISESGFIENAQAAMSATPDSFLDDSVVPIDGTAAGQRGPLLWNIEFLNNSINGLQVAANHDTGQATFSSFTRARWDDPVVYALTSLLRITPGSELVVDPGTVARAGTTLIKSRLGALEIQPRGSLIVGSVGTDDSEIIFTSLFDDIGADTNNDGPASSPRPGDWGSIFTPAPESRLNLAVAGPGLEQRVLSTGPTVVFDEVRIRFGGGIYVDNSVPTFGSGVLVSQVNGAVLISGTPCLTTIDQCRPRSALQLETPGYYQVSNVLFERNGHPDNNVVDPPFTVFARVLRPDIPFDLPGTLVDESVLNENPFIRGNSFSDSAPNELNGMEVVPIHAFFDPDPLGEVSVIAPEAAHLLNVEFTDMDGDGRLSLSDGIDGSWDDTDIVHIVRDTVALPGRVQVPNVANFGIFSVTGDSQQFRDRVLKIGRVDRSNWREIDFETDPFGAPLTHGQIITSDLYNTGPFNVSIFPRFAPPPGSQAGLPQIQGPPLSAGPPGPGEDQGLWHLFFDSSTSSCTRDTVTREAFLTPTSGNNVLGGFGVDGPSDGFRVVFNQPVYAFGFSVVGNDISNFPAENIEVLVRDPNGVVAMSPQQPLGAVGFRGFISAFPIVEVRINEAPNFEVCALRGNDDAGFDDFVFSTVPVYPFVPTATLPSAVLTLASQPAGTVLKSPFNKPLETLSDAEPLIVKLIGTAPAGPDIFGPDAFGDHATQNRAFVGGGFQIGMDDGMDDVNELFSPIGPPNQTDTRIDDCALHGHTDCQSHGNSDWGLGSSFRILGVSANEATGQSRVPVVLTSLFDDSEGPKGLPHNTDVDFDILNNLPGPLTGVAGAPVSGDWGDIFIGARSAGDRDDLRVRDLLGRLVADAQAIPGRAVTPENPLLPPELDESQGSVILDARIKYGAKIRVQGASFISDPRTVSDAFGQQAFFGSVDPTTGEADNGSLVIAHNEIFNMRDAGVISHPGYLLTADAVHDNFVWVPAEPWVYNNVIAYVQALDGVTRSGTVGGYGVRCQGANLGEPVHFELLVTANDGGTSCVIMHNTIFGTIRGVQVGPDGAALAINNLISDVTDGLIMDPGNAGGRWQAGFNLFFDVPGGRDGLNNIDGNASYTGSLFLDPNIGDFRLRPFSPTGQPNPAIDSALGEYAPASHWSKAIDDTIVRLPLPVTVFNTSPLGPEKDLFGSVRQDDVRVPNRPPLVGVGAEVWFDIGAVESRDFGAPVVRDAVAELTTRNVALVPRTFPIPNIGEIPTRFVITVSEDLDPGTLTKQSIELVPAGKDQQFQGTEIPVDILIDFDPATNRLIVTPSVRLDEDLFKLTVRGTGNAVTDLDGIRLDGEFPGRQTPCAAPIPTPPCTVAATGFDSGEGLPGGDFVTFFNIGIPPQVVSIKVTDGRSPQQPTPMLGPPRGVDADFLPDEAQFRVENPPTEIEVKFSKPVRVPNPSAFLVVAYGIDGVFGTPGNRGDDIIVNGTISPATGTASDTWTFFPAIQGALPINSIWRIELDGTSTQVSFPRSDAITDENNILLDGEFFSGDEDTNLNGLLDGNEDRNGNGLLDSGQDFLPSGDLVSGGDFIGYFQVGDLVPPATAAFFIDDDFIPSPDRCPKHNGVPVSNGVQSCPFSSIGEWASALRGEWPFFRDRNIPRSELPNTANVFPGVYREPVELIGGNFSDVTLVSIKGDTQTIIDVTPGTIGADGQPVQAAVTLRGVGGATVSGFQITSNGMTGVIVDVAALGQGIRTNLITSNTIFGNEIGVLGRLGKGKGVRLENNVIWANTVSAVQILGAFGDATADIVNNTIVFNQEGIRLSNIGVGLPRVANIFNNIIVGSNGAGIVSTRTASARIDFNDVFQNLGGNYLNVGVSGTRNIAVDPRFVRPIRPTPGRRLIPAEADWHLLSFSPAIDAGLGTEDRDPDGTGPLSPDGQLNCGRDGICGTFDIGDEDVIIVNDELDFSPLVDHDGNPRFDDPNVTDTGRGTPTFVDIGALERQAISTGTPGGPVGAVTAVRALDQVLAGDDYLQIPIEPEQLPSWSRDKYDWMDELDSLLESGALKKSGLFKNRHWRR